MTKKKAKKNHHLFKNEHGWWYFQYKVRGGRRYKFSLATRLISEARKARNAYLDEIRRYGYIRQPEPERKTFGMVAKEWEKWKITKIDSSIRQYTFDDLYLYELKRHILPKFAKKAIKEIDFVDIDTFVGSLKRQDGKPMAGSTKYNIMVPFRGVMKFALQKGYIDKNPMDLIEPVKRNHKKPQPLSLEEVKIFLDNVIPHYKEFFTIMFLTGMRFGEAAALKWHNVDMVKGEFKIVETYVRKTVLKPKTRSSVRIVKMAQTVKEAFRVQMKRTMGKSDHVFLNTHGRRLKAESVNNHVFKPALQNAGLPQNLSCKDTRGTYITNAIDNHETLGFVQKQVGHSSTNMIVKHYYNHISQSEDGSKLDEAFKQSEKVTRILPTSKMER